MPQSNPAALPERFASPEALEEFLARPSPELVAELAAVPGDLLILGAGGKMGPTLARLARAASPARRILAVARFSEPGLRARLEGWGIETIACDLLDPAALAALPDAPNVVFMAGHKFGAAGQPALTWAMNTLLPARVAERYARARIVAFSTGNVYPFSPVAGPAPTEATPPAPVGEYAMSCLGRERMFEYASARAGTPGRLVRLNYAAECRYGVLVDLAQRVLAGTPIDLTMGYVNLIWQGDANAQALRCLAHVTTPTTPLNVSGADVLRVRTLAEALAGRLGTPARFTGREAPEALLTDTAAAQALFGPPAVPLARMLDWVADWLLAGHPTLGKPTKFEVRTGRF